MPIFEYICRDCDHQFETLVRGGATPECPSCHGDRLQKQLSVFAVSTRGAATPAHAAVASPCGRCGQAGACQFTE